DAAEFVHIVAPVVEIELDARRERVDQAGAKRAADHEPGIELGIGRTGARVCVLQQAQAAVQAAVGLEIDGGGHVRHGEDQAAEHNGMNWTKPAHVFSDPTRNTQHGTQGAARRDQPTTPAKAPCQPLRNFVIGQISSKLSPRGGDARRSGAAGYPEFAARRPTGGATAEDTSRRDARKILCGPVYRALTWCAQLSSLLV